MPTIISVDGALALRESLGAGFDSASGLDASAPGLVDPGRSVPSTRVSGAVDAALSNHLVSGAIVWALSTTGVSLACVADSRVRRIVSLLISVPVWLIILLLSPFDAYAAARLITEARWQQGRI